ncbi:hypothetical protein [Helicobacter sp.]|uniref:GHMP family kinase ATP-binding protein n=1 Tax=Helicobacter sp. TaxID=218 RepID=UPI00388FC4AD
MLLKAYPKINLYLHITGTEQINSQRYHLLRSRFVRVEGALYDEIAITPAQGQGAESSDIVQGNFPCAIEESSVYRALHALRMIDGVRFPPVHIEVCKHIPSGAGLGGGSADAGVVLRALIKRYGEGFKGAGAQLYRALFGDCADYSGRGKVGSKDMESKTADSASALSPAIALAKGLGADVAFFLQDLACAEVSGIGERIAPCEPALQDISCFELYTPEIFCDTTRVYRQYSAMINAGELCFDTQELDTLPSSAILGVESSVDFGVRSAQNLATLNALYRPACVLYPELADVQKQLGAGWYFSGSGSSFFRPIMDSTQSRGNSPQQSAHIDSAMSCPGAHP